MGEYEYGLVGKGLRLLYWGEILRILSTLLLSLMGIFYYLPSLFGWLGLIGVLAGVVMALEGLNKAGAAHDNYRAALTLLVTEFACSVVAYVAETSPVATMLTWINTLLYVLAVYFICQTSGALLRERGEEELARRAGDLWKATLLCRSADLALFLTHGDAGFLALAVSLASLAVLVMQLLFYGKAGRILME